MKNKQGGFVDFVAVIIAIIIILLLMRYYGITFTGIWYWLKGLFVSVW